MADDNLKDLQAQIELQERSLASEQRKQEIMKAGGIHYKQRRAHAQELLKLEDAIQAKKEEALKIEKEQTKLASQHAKEMKTLALLGGGFMATLSKIKDLTKQASDNTRATADSMGINVNEAKKMNKELLAEIQNGNMFNTNLKDATKSAHDLKDAFGGSMKFTAEQAVHLDVTSKKLGISTTQAAKFGKLMFATEGASLKTSQNLLAGIKSLSDASGVKFSAVMDDIAANGESIANTFGKSGKEIGIMAVAARRMGFELQDMVSMSNALLDVEGSIENQMKFNMLTGKNINLDKARALAIEGDHAAMMEEVVAQAGDLENLNQLEIKALNDALGVDIMKLKNAEQLAKQKEEEGIKAQDIANTEALIREGQLEEFANKEIERQAAATAEERRMNFEQNMLDIAAQQLADQDKANNLALILQGIQLTISGIMAAQAVSSSLKAATEKDSLRSAIAAIPKLVAQAASRAAAAVSALVTNAAATFGIGTAIALAAAAGGAAWLYSNIAKAEQTGDLGIDPNGGPVVMSPKEGGIFQGTKNDGVSMSPSHGTKGGPGGSINMDPLIRKMDELIAAVNQARVLSVDGYQLNEAMHLEKTPVGL